MFVFLRARIRPHPEGPTHLYHDVRGAYQLTIFSMHAAPVISLRLLMYPRPSYGLCVTWMACSWHLRRPESPANYSLSLLELTAALINLSPTCVGGLLLLQFLIVVGFWTGVLIATRSESFSFLPLDRQLRRLGLLGTLQDPKAREDFLRPGICGHLLLQLFFGLMLLSHLDVGWRSARSVMALGEMLLGYVVILLVGAASLPPYRLPYNLGVMPRRLRLPLRSESVA
eukprot:CAMPEP_0183373504 /NCGR_PEP_ID=MMETSP0164_2-20130417/111609_1 /TAXON_ID=221442 /ORGANISM="Coccolithus pelagicus ssp braarudi, Strain PLY182g" /LENGTH=227 /DNA_ID=CAMNT_0025550389 /DNA_START=125 /DNA_END=808 /DNA_ORIENTATION=-